MSITVGSVAVDVVPDASKFASQMRAGLVPEASRVGDEVGRVVGERINARVKDALRDGLGSGGTTARTQGTKTGEEYGGAFARTAKTRIDAALRNLPKPRVGVDATELDAELAEIRRRLAALSDVRVGVDLDAGQALAEITSLQARLDELGARSPDIQIKVDAVAAAAELAAIHAEVDKLDGRDVDIHVDDHGSTSALIGSTAAAEGSFSGLAAAGAALGPAIIPVAAAVAAAVAGIGAGAAAAAAGLGVLFLGLSGVGAAVKQLGQEQSKTGAQAARSASQQVSAAAAIASAEQQVGDARRSIADAQRQAAQGVEQALQRERDAEQNVTDAVRTERQALADLSAARRQAKQDIEDLTLQVQDGALAQRQATLDVQSARENLARVLSDPRSTLLQRQQAQLSYDEAVQQVKDLGVRQQRLVQQQADAAKAGVNGAAGVVAATQRVSDSELALTRARREAVDAQKAVTEAQRAGAERILQAQERLISAERQLGVAHASAAAAAVAGYGATGNALAKLSPAGQAFAKFLNGLRGTLTGIKNAAQAGLLPGLQAGLTALLPVMPALTRFVGSLAKTMGDLFREAGKALTGPFWAQFFGFLSRTAGPNLVIFAKMMGNFITGLAGLFQALAPFTQQLGEGLLHLSERFARFGETAAKNKSFQAFLAYVQRTGPLVMKVLGDLLSVLGKVAVGLAPLGEVVLKVVDALAQLIKQVPAPVLGAIAAALIALWAGLGPVGAALGAVAAGATSTHSGLSALKTLFEKIRPILADYVHNILAGLRSAFSSIFSTISHNKKQLTELGQFMVGVARIAEKVLGPIMRLQFQTIGKVISGVINVISDVVRVVDFLVSVFTKLPGRISHATHGMWDGIKVAFKSAINTIIGWWDKFVSYLKIPGISTPFGSFGGVDLGKGLHIDPLAAGGPAYAGRPYLVGEKGPELMIPRTSGTVLPHDLSKQLLSGQSAGPRLQINGGINVQSAPNERAAVSVPRALRSASWLAEARMAGAL